MDTGGSPELTSLDENQDTFETFLLCLLQAFTQHKQRESASPSSASAATTTLPWSDFKLADISPEALNTLSSEQVQVLVTSNSVNYDVIQQIMTQKQRQHSQSSPVSEMAEASMTTAGQSVSTNVPTIQVTPEQLKQLQVQVSDLIRNQQIILPPDLSVEQQQQLIHTLLVRQLHMQQKPDTGGGGSSTILNLLKGEGEGAGRAEPQPKSEAPQMSTQPSVPSPLVEAQKV